MASYVITGGPGAGKTSVVEELGRLGYNVLEEAPRKVATSDGRFAGKTIKEMDFEAFHDAIFKLRKKDLEALGEDDVFLDRGIGDILAYDKIHGVETTDERLDFVNKFRHDMVFILDFLDFYETDDIRDESEEEQKEIHNEIINTYKKLGYDIVFVPFMSVKERARFIIDKVNERTLK